MKKSIKQSIKVLLLITLLASIPVTLLALASANDSKILATKFCWDDKEQAFAFPDTRCTMFASK